MCWPALSQPVALFVSLGAAFENQTTKPANRLQNAAKKAASHSLDGVPKTASSLLFSAGSAARHQTGFGNQPQIQLHVKRNKYDATKAAALIRAVKTAKELRKPAVKRNKHPQSSLKADK